MPELKMPRRTLVLTQEERAELVRVAQNDPRAYLRERATALLRIADGRSPHWVATAHPLWTRLSKRHPPDTVYAWLNDYLLHRRLRPQPARRRAFSPGGSPPGATPREHSSVASRKSL